MHNVFTKARWSPYAVGAVIGVLSWITFAGMGKALGTSTTMVRAAGAAEGLVAKEHVESNAYFSKYIVGTAESPAAIFEWQFALVIFLAIGAFIAAWLARRPGERPFVEHVPTLWAWRFGSSRTFRYSMAFLGGAVMLFGARLAGGCTSGHGISGGLQLAVSSWTFIFFTFAAGIGTAFILYGKKGRDHVV